VQLVLDPVKDYLPAPQFVQPSVDVDAEVFVDYCPAGHCCVTHDVLEPAIENLPNSQSVQPSVFEVAVSKVDYCPAGHS
jgi:hypothetical protein